MLKTKEKQSKPEANIAVENMPNFLKDQQAGRVCLYLIKSVLILVMMIPYTQYASVLGLWIMC